MAVEDPELSGSLKAIFELRAGGFDGPGADGAIEGTCKHLVKERFAVTGAHWRRKNIGDILTLREAIFNDEWDAYWKPKAKTA